MKPSTARITSFAVTPEGHQLLNILIGFGIAGTGFGVILAIIGRASSDENRSLALGVGTAAGSAGQVIGPPLAAGLLTVTTEGTKRIYAISPDGVEALRTYLDELWSDALTAFADHADRDRKGAKDER